MCPSNGRVWAARILGSAFAGPGPIRTRLGTSITPVGPLWLSLIGYISSCSCICKEISIDQYDRHYSSAVKIYEEVRRAVFLPLVLQTYL